MLTRSLLFLILVVRAATAGNLRGIVHDPDHRPIPGAEVTIAATQSDWHKIVETNGEGEFEVSAVPVGE